MSGQGGSIGSIILGVVVGVVAIATGQYYLGFTAVALIAGGAIGLSYKPKVTDGQSAQNQELRISPASVGNPVPVVFGQCLVTPNYLRVSTDFYTIEPYYGETQSVGGKGGGNTSSQSLAGYKHFLQWEVGLCMGPIDAVGQVVSTPGEVDMIDSPDPWTVFSDSSPEEITLAPAGTEGDFQGGVVRVYRGAVDQTRESTGDPYAADGMNYRPTAWALMGAGTPFCIGTSSYVKTYRFWVRRLPVCVRDNGTTVTGIKTRGSASSGDPEYVMANPVAIIYEVLTNKIWGRKLSSDIINEASFISVSEFCETKKIGLSLLLESADNLGDILNGIYQHCGVTVLWEGTQYIAICTQDLDYTHGSIQTLSDSDFTNLTVSVPTWEAGVFNELRAEFTSDDRGARGDIVHVQSDSAIDVLGGRINPKRIQLPALTTYGQTYKQAVRALAEMSFPRRSLSGTMNHYKSQLEIGRTFRLIWMQGLATPVTSYYQLVNQNYGDPSDPEIKVVAVEDLILPPVEGVETSVTIPTLLPWERITEVTNDDVTEATPPINPEDIPPIETDTTLVFEVPAIATKGREPRTLVAVERYPAISGVAITWSIDDNVYRVLAAAGGTVITGTLLDALPGNQFTDRSPDGYTFELNQANAAFAANNGQILLRCSVVDADTDDLSDLVLENRFYIVCQDELIQVGKIDFVTGKTYRMRNIIRGKFGTRIRQHPTGAVVFYSETQLNGVTSNTLPQNREMWFNARYTTYRGAAVSSTTVQPYHEAPNDDIYLGVGIRPLPPSEISIVDGGATVTLRARPRFFDAGAGVDDFVTAMQNPVQDIGAMTFSVAQVNTSGTILDEIPLPVAHTYTAGDLATAGYIEVTVTKQTNAKTFRLYSALRGQTSVHYCEFSI